MRRNEIPCFPVRIGVNSTSSQWVGSCDRLGSSVILPFSRTSTAFLWPTFSETDNNSRENIVELRASRAILSGRPGCAHSSSKSPGTITHITGGRGWFLSGISCLNNTSIVIFAILWAEGFGGRVKIFQGFQNPFFMSFMAFRENCNGGSVHFSRTQMFKYFGSRRVKPKLHMKKKMLMTANQVSTLLSSPWSKSRLSSQEWHHQSFQQITQNCMFTLKWQSKGGSSVMLLYRCKVHRERWSAWSDRSTKYWQGRLLFTSYFLPKDKIGFF